MNQPELAELLGVSVATVSRICSGERRPSMDLMYVIEERMGWPFTDQANEIRCDAYGSMFRQRMEKMECQLDSDLAEPAGSLSGTTRDVDTGSRADRPASRKDG